MTPDPRAALLRAALDAAERGWPVFPLLPGTKRPALHGETACPATGDCAGGHRKWEQRATTDPDRIHAAWSVRPFNVGVACGPADLVVVDLDMPKTTGKGKSGSETPDGVATFRALCERAGHTVPTTRTVRTAGGGLHLYFAAPVGVRLGNTAGTIASLVDSRAHGGYVVAVGSTTPEGAYQVTDPAPVAPLPEWLCSLLTARQELRAVTPLPSHSRASRRASAALTAESADVATAPEGTRNARLLAAARAMGRFVAWGDIDRHVVEEAFQGAAESAGLPSSECRATVRSALNWSIRTCRTRQTA
ncbi:bifunctional DNA primase/polymerase [Streptomyces sp. N2-109]|uniref:Bifunctional DNA primase/polymerase n=1 Tax=Streptomyces gossypii TaxID=2883101 RepID=A0ABT2JPQ4_9ACTN|nr:bifunctional DNA primase/polymerase [Streptomyces gossypii]MCT2589360.1 bifunctional DNA primase/polymerase [Streptomyces gossypii]